jgi:hypothetical protein
MFTDNPVMMSTPFKVEGMFSGLVSTKMAIVTWDEEQMKL